MSRSNHQQITKRLHAVARKYGPAESSYFRSQLKFIGNIPAGVQRNLHKKEFLFDARVWQYCWKNTEYFEVMNQALLFFEGRRGALELADWKVLKPWSARIENWAHSDALSCYYAELLESFPKEIMPVFEQWKEAKNPWLRRLSIVSLFYYSRLRKKRVVPFSTAKRFVLDLLADDFIYVKKGVGWTLREMYNVYPKQTVSLLNEIVPALPAATWQAATEKLEPKQKEYLKKRRQRV
jgi:3-methyladenine DNA glycosylase AlkD